MQISGYIWIAILAVTGGYLTTSALDERHRFDERVVMQDLVSERAALVEEQLADFVLIAEGTRAALEADPNLSQERYAQVVARLVDDASGIINLAAAPQDVIAYVFPLEGNRAALGLDIASREDFAAALRVARQTGETVLSGPFDLVQGGRGLIARATVANIGDAAEATGSDWGTVSLVVDSEVVLERAGLTGGDDTVTLRVMNNGQPVFGQRDAAPDDPVEAVVDVAGITWTIQGAPAAGWSTISPDTPRVWVMILLFALGASAILFAFQKTSRRQLRAERHLQEAVNSLDDGFAIYDSDDRLVMCNDRYRELYSASAPAIMPGATFESILRAGLASGQYLEAIGREEEWLEERLRAHREPGQTMEQQLPDGRWLRVSERRTESGNTVGFRVDISELKLALSRSEAASAAKSVFLNNVSHELRTPMTVVLGFNAFIRHCDKLPEFQHLRDMLEAGNVRAARQALEDLEMSLKHFGSQIDRSGQQLVDLINSILDLSAVEAGQLKLTFEPVNLTQLARDVVEQFRPLTEKKGLQLQFGGEEALVEGDSLRLRQILINLLGNALKFTDAGRITVRVGTSGSMAWLEVDDTGPGIPEDQQDDVFERFMQIQSDMSSARGGVGLGLPICRELARLHGGSVSVRSKVGEGTTFRLELSANDGQLIAAE